MKLWIESVYRISESEQQAIIKRALPEKAFSAENVIESVYRIDEREQQAILKKMLPEKAFSSDNSEEVKSLKYTIRSLMKDNEKLESDNEQLETDNEKLSDENKKLKSENDRLSAENSTLRQQLAEKKAVLQQSAPVQRKPAVKSKKKVDRSKFKPLVDGEKEVKEIADSWDEIFASIDDGSYRQKYKIGNYKSLGIVNMQIAAFDADPLADGSGRAAITWISIELLKTEYHMNHDLVYKRRGIINKKEIYTMGTGSIGGWTESEMRKYLNDKVRAILPGNVKFAVKTVLKYSCSKDTDNNFVSNEITQDALWIPSLMEVFGSKLDDSKYEDKAFYYKALFSNNISRTKSAAFYCDYDKIRPAACWWLRSAFSSNTFDIVNMSGSNSDSNANVTGGVALGFCT